MKASQLPLCLLISVIGLTMSPSAAEQAPRTPTEQVFDLSLYGLDLSEVPPEVEQMVAVWANPIVVRVGEGQSPREATLQACPGAGEAYFKVLQERAEELNPHIIGGFNIDEPFSDLRFAMAPNCLQSHSERVTVESGQRIEDEYLKEYTARLGTKNEDEQLEDSLAFVKSVARLNDRDVASLSDIQADEELLIPLPRADFQTSREGAEAISGAVLLEIGDWAVSVEKSVHGGESISRFGAELKLNDALNCGFSSETALQNHHSLQFARDYEAIFWNIIKAREFPHSDTVSKTDVAILDTGLPDTDWWTHGGLITPLTAGQGDTMLLPKLLRRDSLEGVGAMFENKHPALWSRVLERMKHSETVLGASLGGYYSYLYNSSFGVIRPSVLSMFEFDVGADMRPELTTSDRNIRDAITAMTDMQVPFIVNISAGTGRDADQLIRKALLETIEGNDLFVVAAGNYGANAAVDSSEVYPANYGGQELSEVPMIVVGGYMQLSGLDSSDVAHSLKVWDDSNRGPHVDILALGCGVQTVKFENEGARNLVSLDHQNGTSLSAPQVTFTAAIVRHLLSHRQRLSRAKQNVPIALKNRILASADLHPELSKDVVDGRVLNLTKAVNVFSDLVETESGNYLRGKVQFKAGASKFLACHGKHRIDPSNVLKIARWNENGVDGYKYYFLEKNKPSLSSCTDFISPKLEFLDETISDSGSAAVPVELEQFVDIVFAIDPL